MKKILIIVMSTFFVHGLAHNCSECKMYKLALDMIIASRDSIRTEEVTVSDYCIEMNRGMFSHYLLGYPESKEQMDRYDINHLFSFDDISFSDCLHEISLHFPQNSDNMIYFSKIEDNILMAEFVDNVKNRISRYNISKPTMDYNGLIRFNESDRYIILFDDSNQIKAFFCVHVVYD